MRSSQLRPVETVAQTGARDSRRSGSLQTFVSRLRGHVADPLYRNSYFLMAGAGVTAGSGFIFWVLAARSFDAAEVGRAAGLVSAVSLISYLTSLGLPYGALRFGGDRSNFSTLVNVALLLSAASSLIASVLFALGATVWSHKLVPLLNSPGEIALFVFFNIVIALGVLLDSFLAAQRSAQWVLIRAVVPSVAKLALVVALTSLGAFGIYVAMYAPLAAATVALILGLPLLFRFYRPTRPRVTESLRSFINFSIRNSPSSLLTGAPIFLLPLIVLSLRGARETAYFYVAFGVANVSQLVPTTISQISLSEAAGQDAWDVARRARKFALMLLVPAVAAIWIVAGPVLSAYGGEYRANADASLRFLALGTLPWALIAVNLSALRVERRDRAVFFASAAYCFLSLSMTVLFGISFGLEGLALGWALGVFMTALSLEVWLRWSGRATPVSQDADSDSTSPPRGEGWRTRTIPESGTVPPA